MVKKNESSSTKKIMNRGAWTAEEDQKLAEYVKIHGDKKWRSLPAKAGLNRCGKSCRLRWLNYLRPGIKRGNISEDEEDLIIRLHNLIGNRWSLIAARLPGRTDNEIKNHWNTHLSKKSLTIHELNHKLNHKNENGCDRPPAFPDVGSTLSSEPACPGNKSNGLEGEQAKSETLNGLIEDEYTVDDLFDFSSATSLLVSESDQNGADAFGMDGGDHLTGQAMYGDLFAAEMQGPGNGWCFDQRAGTDQLDFDTLARLLEYEYDPFFSFSYGSNLD